MKLWYIFGEQQHMCGQYPCRCPEQLVDIADEDGDIVQLIPRDKAKKIIEAHNRSVNGRHPESH